jgi:single-strand DNA-binding protein
MNKVIIIGNLGQDPETKYTQGGTAITRFSVATTEKWKDKQTGELQEETSWHRIVAFGKRAEVIGEYVKRGHKIALEGRLKYGSYEKDGVKHYTTDIVLDNFEFLERKQSDDSSGGSSTRRSGGAPRGPQGAPSAQQAADANFDDDEIPF